MKKTSIAAALLVGITFLSGCSMPFAGKGADTPAGNSNQVTDTPGTASTSNDQSGEVWVYRVVGNSRKGFERYTDRAKNMYKYPDGIDFKTQKEADEYIEKQAGGELF